MERRGPEKQGKGGGGFLGKGNSTCKNLQIKNSGKGSAVVRAEASEVPRGHIIKGLKCQAKEFGLDPEGNRHLEESLPLRAPGPGPRRRC